MTSRFLPQLVHQGRLDDLQLIDSIVSMAARMGRDGFANQQRTILGRHDSLDLLTALRCPTLVSCGRDDELPPAALSEEMVDLGSGADLVLVDDCGHFPALERPDATRRALQR